MRRQARPSNLLVPLETIDDFATEYSLPSLFPIGLMVSFGKMNSGNPVGVVQCMWPSQRARATMRVGQGQVMMRILTFLFFLFGFGSVAQAAQVKLVAQPDLAKDVAAFPRLGEDAPFAAKINAALSNLEKRALDGAKDCTTTTGESGFERSVEVTMQGPRFISFLARDEWSCGAHPDAAATPFVYDLTTGRPADWTKLLPPKVAGKAKVLEGDVAIGVLKSPVLKRAYLKDLEAGGDADCKTTLEDTDFNFMLWPDAKSHSLVIGQNDLPHAVAACGGDVNLSLDALRGFGVGEALLSAIRVGQPASFEAGKTPAMTTDIPSSGAAGRYERSEQPYGGGSVIVKDSATGVQLTIQIGGRPDGAATKADCGFIAEGQLSRGVFKGTVTRQGVLEGLSPEGDPADAGLPPLIATLGQGSIKFDDAATAKYCGGSGSSLDGDFHKMN